MTDTGTTANAPAPKVTVPMIRSRKRNRGDLPIVMLTAYDTPGARIADAAGVDIVLVGDSVANAVLGHADTLQVDVGVMAHHVAAVGRATPRALVVGDMPWLSYHVSAEDAVRNAAVLVRAGAEAVKLEGGRARLDVVEALLNAEIPVMGHLGLTPQSVHAMGGYRVQARDTAAAEALMNDAKALAAAGCFAMVLEGVPDVVAARVTAEVDVPTIGIGAGGGLRRPGARVPRSPRPARGDPAEVRPPVRRPDRGGGDGGVVVGGRRPWRDLPLRGRDVPPPVRALIPHRPPEGARWPSATMAPGHDRVRFRAPDVHPAPRLAGPRALRRRVQREVSRACGLTRR